MTDIPVVSTKAATSRKLPDGLGKQHLEQGKGVERHASILSLGVLGCFLAIAMTGTLGGGFNSHLEIGNDRIALAYDGPTKLRNGMFFEAHVLVRALQPIKKLEISLEPSLVHDLTMNSMVPAAADETFEDGAFRFSFDKMETGDRFDVKFDFQINPSLFAGTHGRIAVYDGDTELATIPVDITVWP